MDAALSGKFFNRFLILLLVIAVGWRLLAAFGGAGDTDLTVWGDRDLWRALTIGQHWPIYGPEINGGARPPGGAFYLLLAALLALQPGVLAAHVGLLALFAASLLLAGLFFAREVSARAGLLVAAALAGSGALADALWVWNPGYVLFFATVATVCGYRFVKTGGAWSLGLTATALSIGLQIHLQMFEMAVALVLAGLVYRRGLAAQLAPRAWRRLVAAGLAGFLLPYLPSLLAGGIHSLWSAAVVPEGAVHNYVFGDFQPWDKLGLLYGLIGGDPWAFLPGPIISRGGNPLLDALADLLAAVLALGFLVAPLFRRRDPGSRPTGLFSIAVIVYLLVALGSSVNFRHLVAAVPAVSVMIGLSAERLLVRASAARLPLALAATLLVALLAVRPVSLALAPAGGLGGTGALKQAEIAATLKPAFYPDSQSFESHAALFRRFGERGWRLDEEGVSGQMNFIYSTSPVAPVTAARSECVAVIPKEGPVGQGLAAQLAASPAFSGLSVRFAPMAAESAHFAYFPYTTADGNCLKTFSNAYIPTAFESRYLPAGAPAAALGSGDAAVFVIAQPGQAHPLGIELRRDGEDYRAVLQGRLLRGYTGLTFQTILDPSLCLVGPSGVQVASFGRLPVGSPQRGSLAPWRSAAFRLGEGSYELWLTGRDGKRPIPVSFYLGRLSVPDLAASRVEPADSHAVPKGCPLLVAGEPAGRR